MNITPNKLTIAQLFAASNEQFVVPSYQRRYAWTYNQVAALYEDIDMLREGDGHLFGMIILHTDYHTGGLNRPEVVDGQQRLTTLTILLKAIQERFRALDNHDKVQEIEKMLTCSSLEGARLPKLALGDLDDTDMRQILGDDPTYEYTNRRILEAYNWFDEWFHILNNESLSKFYFKLINVAVVIRLDVGMAKDAYKLFETINNRGLRLSPTDIIKNFLLGHAAKIGPEILAETKSLWSSIIINLDGIDSNDFFRQYMCALLKRKVTMTQLVAEFKAYYFKHVEHAELLGEFDYFVPDASLDDATEDEDDTSIELDSPEIEPETFDDPGVRVSITEILRELKKTSMIYQRIHHEDFDEVKISRHLGYLNRILSKPAYIFLMHLLQRDLPVSLKVDVLKTIETFMLRRHICEERTGLHDAVFASLIPSLEAPDILSDVKERLKPYFPSDEDFRLSFPKHRFKGKLIDRAKYVLSMIEYHKRGDTSELMISSDSEVHLEHIIPQKISTSKSKQEFGNWVEYLGENSIAKHKSVVDLIGNMTLLADKLNIRASNNPFAMKLGSYSASNFLITQNVAENQDFGFSQIQMRGDNFADIALKIWSF